MKDYIKIKWEQIDFESFHEYDDTSFYMFARGRNVLYIGHSYKQMVQNEIKQSLKRLKIATSGLSIWLGYIVEMSYGKKSEQIVKDAEGILISTQKPSLNIQNVDAYYGRQKFVVYNSNCPYLDEKVWSE